MDAERFDTVTRILGGKPSRRAVVYVVLAGALAPLFGFVDAEARRRRRKKKRRTKCKPNCRGKVCGGDGCGGLCGKCPGDPDCMYCRNGLCASWPNGTCCTDCVLRCAFGVCAACGGVGQPCCGAVCEINSCCNAATLTCTNICP